MGYDALSPPDLEEIFGLTGGLCEKERKCRTGRDVWLNWRSVCMRERESVY